MQYKCLKCGDMGPTDWCGGCNCWRREQCFDVMTDPLVITKLDGGYMRGVEWINTDALGQRQRNTTLMRGMDFPTHPVMWRGANDAENVLAYIHLGRESCVK